MLSWWPTSDGAGDRGRGDGGEEDVGVCSTTVSKTVGRLGVQLLTGIFSGVSTIVGVAGETAASEVNRSDSGSNAEEREWRGVVDVCIGVVTGPRNRDEIHNIDDVPESV